MKWSHSSLHVFSRCLMLLSTIFLIACGASSVDQQREESLTLNNELTKAVAVKCPDDTADFNYAVEGRSAVDKTQDGAIQQATAVAKASIESQIKNQETSQFIANNLCESIKNPNYSGRCVATAFSYNEGEYEYKTLRQGNQNDSNFGDSMWQALCTEEKDPVGLKPVNGENCYRDQFKEKNPFYATVSGSVKLKFTLTCEPEEEVTRQNGLAIGVSADNTSTMEILE